LKSKAKSLARYFNDSALWLGQVSRVLKKSNGTAYVVVGSNTTHGLSLDIPRGLFEISSLVGLKASTVKTYQIKNSYMQYTTNGERIRVETVQKMVPA